MRGASSNSVPEDNRPSRSRWSPGRRGLALVAGFWLVITALLGARVAMFDEIAGARVAGFVSSQVASLAAAIR